MSQPSPVCPDCKVSMDSGFVVDFTYGTDGSQQSSWVEGTAQPSWVLRALPPGFLDGLEMTMTGAQSPRFLEKRVRCTGARSVEP
jgi:hypothetical protein